MLKEEKKFLRRVYTLVNEEEIFYGKSNYVGSNGNLKRIKLYDERKCEIGVIKRTRFKAPWNNKIYRDVKIVLKDNNGKKKIIT